MSDIFNFLLLYFPKELKYKSQKFFTSYSCMNIIREGEMVREMVGEEHIRMKNKSPNNKIS